MQVCPSGILVCGMLCGSTPSIVGKCRGKGDIARLTLVIGRGGFYLVNIVGAAQGGYCGYERFVWCVGVSM